MSFIRNNTTKLSKHVIGIIFLKHILRYMDAYEKEFVNKQKEMIII
jgi:hypothetical protein